MSVATYKMDSTQFIPEEASDMNNENHRVRTVFECRSGHRHELCVTVTRGVPTDLRCEPDTGTGYGPSGGSGCVVPRDLDERVERVLRDDLLEARRRGFVLIEG